MKLTTEVVNVELPFVPHLPLTNDLCHYYRNKTQYDVIVMSSSEIGTYTSRLLGWFP